MNLSNRRARRRRAWAAFVGLTLAAAPDAGAADWSQLWGPFGDGRAGAADSLPDGPALKARELWRKPIGSGFSGVAEAAGRAYTAAADGGSDYLLAFDPRTGQEHWRARIGETYRGHDGSKDGPISTPAVGGGHVFIVGPRGHLLAADAASGRVAWSHDLKAEYGAADPVYGFGTSPLVVGERVIVQAGGEKQHNLVAFDIATGKLAWSAHHATTTGYSTPVLATIAGVPQVLLAASEKVVAVRPADGALLWSHTLPAQGEPSRPPLVLPDGRVLVPTWNDATMLRVSPEGGAYKVAELWKVPRLKATYSPTVFHDGYLYGFNSSYLMCVDPADGSVKWQQRLYGGSLILVDGHLIVLSSGSGDLHVAAASVEGYREKLRVPVFNAGATTVTVPAFASGRVLVRNVEDMVALEIGG
jgi:outer membrane protein assembly factor BamB